MRIFSVYVHIPFCLRKCNYCDFASRPIELCGGLPAAYPGLLERELALWQEPRHELDFSRLETVYFGGGTPSLLEPEAIASLLARLPGAKEVTLEANPETVDEAKLAAFRRAGIDRLSLGVQSFDQDLLAAMGRGHSPEQARAAVAQARAAGFDNISIDLIYGLPGQTPEQWRYDLEQALALYTQHISLYCLTVSPECPWGRQGIGPLDDDRAADLAELAQDTLTAAGYHHYEIANFARPGYESRHNTAYWQRENYLGLGASAAGCLADHRWTGQRDPELWAEAVSQGQLPVTEEEYLDIDTVLGEAIFLGLRLLDGIDLAAFEQRYGVDPRRRFRRQLNKLTGRGLLEIAGGRLRLTPAGVMLGDRVFAEFV